MDSRRLPPGIHVQPLNFTLPPLGALFDTPRSPVKTTTVRRLPSPPSNRDVSRIEEPLRFTLPPWGSLFEPVPVIKSGVRRLPSPPRGREPRWIDEPMSTPLKATAEPFVPPKFTPAAKPFVPGKIPRSDDYNHKTPAQRRLEREKIAELRASEFHRESVEIAKRHRQELKQQRRKDWAVLQAEMAKKAAKPPPRKIRSIVKNSERVFLVLSDERDSPEPEKDFVPLTRPIVNKANDILFEGGRFHFMRISDLAELWKVDLTREGMEDQSFIIMTDVLTKLLDLC